MPYDTQLAERIERAFSKRRVRFEAKKMMGGLVFMVGGKMCVGVEKHRLMVRLDPKVQDDAMTRPGCRPMDFTGRPLRGFVFVDGDVLGAEPALLDWLELALAYNPLAPSSKKSAQKSARRQT